jgi:hypothetical protein
MGRMAPKTSRTRKTTKGRKAARTTKAAKPRTTSRGAARAKATARRARKGGQPRRRTAVERMLEREPLETPQLANEKALQDDGFEHS